MILYLNISTALFILVIAIAVIIGSWQPRSKLFWMRSTLILIPLVSQVRQILSASGLLDQYPLFVFLIYFLLRCIGPLLNWHTHLQFGKPIKYSDLLHLATYALLGYVFYDLIYACTLDHQQRVDYAVGGFEKPGWFSFTYPVIQLAHIGQAVFILSNNSIDKNQKIEKYFMKVMLYTIIIMLITLQVSYLILDRASVELVVAPLIFIVIYSVIIFVSIRFSSVHKPEKEQIHTSEKVTFEDLSERENQVLSLIAKGKTDKQIGEEIHLSVSTVRTYCRRIYTKLEVNNRTEAANRFNESNAIH